MLFSSPRAGLGRTIKYHFLMKKKSKIILLVLFLVLTNIIVFGVFFLLRQQQGKTYAVVLTKDGFSPKELTINKGDTVVFSTTAKREFWPASNLHPSHDLYPAFDPQLPIEADKTWSFTFDKAGTWQFHDHMAPMFRGKIVVMANNARKDVSNTTCNTIPDPTKRKQCFDTYFSIVLEEKGISSAFDLMDQLFQKDQEFAVSCHDFAHRLGKKAYEVYAKNKSVALSEKSSYCGYGFYHGFMEALLYTTRDVREAQNFCDYAERALKEKSADAGGACYHGIGHGLTEDIPDPNVWGDAQKIINPGLALCQKVSPDKMKKFRCDTGVFNALEILMTNNKYKLSLNPTDPYGICRAQKEEHKEACYTQLVVALLHVTNNNFYKSALFIDAVQNNTYALPAMNTLATELVHFNRDNTQEAINFCVSLKQRFKTTCLVSIAEGLMKYGPPQQEYKEALQFCNAQLMDEDKNACYRKILSILRVWYTAQKSTEICQAVDPKYQYNGCRYN